MRSPVARGLADSLSIAVGYIPVAVSFGLAAVYADFTPLTAVMTSIFIYAGASQFILVTLVAAGTSPIGVVGILLLMNLRHLFYGPALLARMGDRARRMPAFALAAGLTDEVFATSISKLEQQPEHERERWYVGLQFGAYASWVGGTAVGAWFGQGWIQESQVLAQTLGFVLPALFFALLLEIRHLVSRSVLGAAAIAALLTLMFLPSYAAIVTGMLAGALLAVRK